MALQSVDLDRELYFLVAKFLEGGPCKEAAKVLKDELSTNGLLPHRKDWEGKDHQQSYSEVAEANQHVKSNFLKLLCERMGPLIDQYTSPDVKGIRSLLSNGRQSLLRSGREALTFATTTRELPCYHSQPALKSISAKKSSIFTTSVARSLHGAKCQRSFLKDCNMYGTLSLHKRILGHLASVYCVLYDRSGSIIATGADDHLVKLWSAKDGRLVATFRGHTGEIADMAISFDNTVLASGSCDKTIRVWSLQTSACIAVLLGHSGIITSLDFSPLVVPEMSYLVSTGADGTVCFWKCYSKDNSFDPVPLKFNEKSRPGAQMLCSSFSPGGSFLVTGSSDSIIRIYQLLPGPPERIAELSGHADHVDSIQFNHAGNKFVSGSRDGTAKVWYYQGAEWHFDSLSAYAGIKPSLDLLDIDIIKSTKLKVTMVGWSKLDDLVITAITDHSLKVWESKSGQLLHILKGHSDEVFCLESHPQDPYLFLSTGHDGNVILWNLQTGKMVTMLFNMLEGQGHGALFDCRFSPDGTQLAMTDSHGHLCLYGYGPDIRYQQVPYEQFFHTDYRPLIRDANHYVLDEMTQLAPHLMPPPYLVNVDGDPHSIEHQLLIPGRNQTNLPQRRSRPSLNNLPPLLAEIEAAERGVNPGLASPQASNQHDFPPLQSPGGGGVGLRQTGDVEGVRQLQSNSYIIQDVSQADCASWRKRKIAPILSAEDSKKSMEIRSYQGKEELRRYLLEKKRRPQGASKSGPSNITAVKEKRSLRDRRRTSRIQPQAVPQPRTRSRPTYSTRSHTASQEPEEDVDVEIVSSEAEDDWASDSSGEESSECSDWAEEAGMREEREARQRRRARRVVTSDEEEGNEAQTEETSDNARSSPKVKAKEEKPKKQKKPKQPKGPSLKNKEEYILHYQPPEWMMMTKPKKSPYFPQVGDQVYYYRQGHQLYVQEVIVSNAYHCSANKQCYERYHLQAQELCQVVGCHFSVGPPRVCSVKLALIDKDSGVKTGQTFTVKYHDMPDVLDFLVLRQHVEQAERCNWKPGDRFRCVIDDCWWSGVITEDVPFQDEFPESRFQTFLVRWDTGEVERMSPWDLEPTSPDDDAVASTLDDESLALNSSNIPLTEEDQKMQLYVPDDADWPDENPSEAIERISQGFSQFFELPLSTAFIYPVDAQEYPDYFAIVAYPIDLNLIHTRLKENFYRRRSALLGELRLIEQNTELYNEPGSDIVRNSALIVKILSQLIRNPESRDVVTLTNEMTNEDYEISSVNTETEEAEERPETRRKSKRHSSAVSSAGDDAGGSSSSHNSNKTWTIDAISLMNFLISRGDSEPFRQAVDTEAYPEYLTYIEEPMDFSTILHRLQHNQYVTPDCVLRDIRLVFSNSRNFNTNKRSRIYVMTIRLSALFESRAEEFSQQWINVNRPRQLRKSKSRNTRNESNPDNSKGTSSTRGASTSQNHDDSNRRKSSLKLTLRRDLATQFTNNTNNNSMSNGSSSYSVNESNMADSINRESGNGGVRRSGRSIRPTVNIPIDAHDSDSEEEMSTRSERGKRPMRVKPLPEFSNIRRSQRKKKHTMPSQSSIEEYNISDGDSSNHSDDIDDDDDDDDVPPTKRSRLSSSDQSDVFHENHHRTTVNRKRSVDGSEPLIANTSTRYSTRLRNGISCTKTFYDDDIDIENGNLVSPHKRSISEKNNDTVLSRGSRRRGSAASTSSSSQQRTFSGHYSESDESLINEQECDDGGTTTISVSSRGRIRRTASRFADYTDK